MGFTLRFLLGIILVLALCPSSKSASTWRHVKLLSQERSTINPIDQNSEVVNTSSIDEEEEQKPKTDETNKIISEIITKEEEDVAHTLLEHKLDKPLSVTENNDLSKESLETTQTANFKPADLSVSISKYISPEFHDKNNIYKLPTLPDIEKYVSSNNQSQVPRTTSNYDIDKKIKTIQNDIEKTLQYIDEKSVKLTPLYEDTTDNETIVQSDLVKYKNISSIENNGNKIHKHEEIELEQKIDYGLSYHHTLADEQKHLTLSETTYDSKPKTNETEDFKNKIFRTKSTPEDPEVVPEKLNQTERHTALISNKIEHDNSNDNHRVKWSFQHNPTTQSYTTTTGQKEEIIFVPYTKENPINISKRGSTRFIDTITTVKSIERKHTKALDEAAVENQIYPVQILPPNNISKEDTTNYVTLTNSDTTLSIKKLGDDLQNVSVTTAQSVTKDNIATIERGNETESSSTTNTSNIFEATTPTFTSMTTTEENATLFAITPSIDDTNFSTPSTFQNTIVEVSSTPKLHFQERVNENLTTSPTEHFATSNSHVTHDNEVLLTSTTQFAENTSSTTPLLDRTTAEEVFSTGDYASDQTVMQDSTTRKNDSVEPLTIPKATDVTQTNTGSTSTDATISTSSYIPESTTPVQYTEPKLSFKPNKVPKSTTSVTYVDTVSNTVDYTSPATVSVTVSSTTPVVTQPNDNDNIIKHIETITTTTESIHKNIPVYKKLDQDVPAFSKKDFQEETTGSYTNSGEQEEGISGGKIAAIVISCVGAVCFIILAILLFVMRKRHKRFNYGQRCTPVSLDSYSVDNVSTYNSVRRKGMMRASKRSYGNPGFEEASVSNLLNFPALMNFGTNKEQISSEYEDIPQISVQTNELPEGCETKNRYANVIPLPESRVFLSVIDDCPNSDYINANFVTGPKSTKNYYIACQAPMQSTVDDFWRMIWEKQSRVILMLTHLFENGAEKCFDYLPPSEVLDCNRLFGDYQVTLKKREVKEKYVISNLQLKNMVSNTWREVTHLWYLGWPERGVPTEESSLAAFLIEARSYAKASPSENGKLKEPTSTHSENGPVVIHCSPGTGRTGTIIACDIAIREFELTRQVDIPKTVYQIRRNRAGAVQTKEQYAFIYRVITWYANKLTGGVLDSL